MAETTQSDIQIQQQDMPEGFVKVMNPIMHFVLNSPLHGLMDSRLMLLRWRGHKSGNEYTTPVGYAKDGNTLTVYTFSGWKANFKTPHPVEVKLKGEWRSGTGVMDDDPREVAQFIREQVGDDDDFGEYRRFRMRIEGDRHPTVEELIPEVKKRDMVLIKVTLQD